MKLFLDNISNVDYAHFLGFHKGKCKQLHGHTSYNVSVIVEGTKKGPWVVDFGKIKEVVKDTLNLIDHKFVICEKYVRRTPDYYIIEYSTSAGYHYMELPITEVFVMKKEPTLENILKVLCKIILEMLPKNISKVTLKMQEGLGGSVELSVYRKSNLNSKLSGCKRA